jgi:hypothetical protein
MRSVKKSRPEKSIPMIVALSLAFTAFQSVTATAKIGAEGHGGSGIICRDESRKITRVELLDLFEGVNILKLNIPQSQAPVEDQIKSALERIKTVHYVYQKTVSAVEYVQTHLSPQKKGIGLFLTKDIELGIFFQNGCTLDQIATFYKYGDEDFVLLSEEIYHSESMSNTDRAALILHEAFYKIARENGATNSLDTRKLIAHLFAENIDQSKINKIIYPVFQRQTGGKLILLDLLSSDQLQIKVSTNRPKTGFSAKVWFYDENDSNPVSLGSCDFTKSGSCQIGLSKSLSNYKGRKLLVQVTSNPTSPITYTTSLLEKNQEIKGTRYERIYESEDDLPKGWLREYRFLYELL